LSEIPGKTYFSGLSRKTGFKADSLEKVYRMMTILSRIGDIPELADLLALKGGTAIQGLSFGFKRLSVGIDLNYVGSVEKERMLREREEIRRNLLYLFKDLGYFADKPVKMYAEEQFNLHFKNCCGGTDRLKLEINYLERLPVIGTIKGIIRHPFTDLEEVDVLSYPPEELYAGKIRALLVRGTPRDLFDADLIARSIQEINEGLLRKTALFYLSMQSRDVRKIGIDAIEQVTEADLRNNLIPLLPSNDHVDLSSMKGNVLPMANRLLDLSTRERMFFDVLYSDRRVEPGLLFDSEPVSRMLDRHPAVVWRLQQLGK
jgi:predicted nucleotidyltransferase component of viral defense system